MVLKLLFGGKNHFFFGNPGGFFHPQGRIIFFNVCLILAAALYYTGNTTGQGLWSKVLDALPFEALGTPQSLYDNLVKIGFLMNLGNCHPTPIAKFFSKSSGASVASLQSAGAVLLPMYMALYGMGFGCFNFNVLLAIAFCLGLSDGFAYDAIKNPIAKKVHLIANGIFVCTWCEIYNAGISKLSNYQHLLFVTVFTFGMMAWTSRGSGGAAAGGKRGRTRSRSKRR